MHKLQTLWPRFFDGLWILALLALPITSFPFLANLSGALIAPLSGLPILILLILFCIPRLLRGASLPRESLVLVGFALVVLIACGRAYFVDVPTFKGKSIFDQELRALLTMAIGLAFYFVFTMYINDLDRLRKTWRWINLGGMLALGVAMIQAIFIFLGADSFPSWYKSIQDLLVLESPQNTLWLRRVNGLTYEPSWFAHQMVLLYLPLWFAATLQRTSSFQLRLGRLSIENLLLGFGIIIFFLSSPRVGLISFLLIIGYIFILVNLRLLKRISDRIANLARVQNSPAKRTLRILIVSAISLLLIIFYLSLFAIVVYLGSQRDERLALLLESTFTWQEIWGMITIDEYFLILVSNRLIFAERMIYWITGWHIFQLHPFLGVGLGNVGFFFPSQLPAAGWASPEIRNLLFRIKAFPNVKSLWVRLLAETGIIGFAVFAAWLYLLFRSARLSYRSRNSLIKTLALAGQFSLIAMLAEGFSIDSFAMPYFWVAAGLISATGFIYRQDARQRMRAEITKIE